MRVHYHDGTVSGLGYNGLELMRIPALIGVVTASINVFALLFFVRSPEDIYKYALVAQPSGSSA